MLVFFTFDIENNYIKVYKIKYGWYEEFKKIVKFFIDKGKDIEKKMSIMNWAKHNNLMLIF